MPDDFKTASAPSAPSDSGPPPGDAGPPASPGLSETGRGSMQGALDAARAEQAQLDAEAKADAAALDTKFAPSSARADLGDSGDSSEATVVGDPVRDAQYYHEQQRADTCAIAAQQGIIEKHTGNDPGEAALTQEAAAKGWYDNGTRPSDMGKLLEAHGVEVDAGEGDIAKLENELSKGHDVITAVDPGYLWRDESSIGDGHSVWVTGLEKNAAGDVTSVYLNDSGNAEIGAGGKVPFEQFKQAWQPFQNYMVSTKGSASVGERL